LWSQQRWGPRSPINATGTVAAVLPYYSRPASATTVPTTELDTALLQRLLPPYRVVLHNDDHNEMTAVVLALMKCVPSLSAEQATEIMLEAHQYGQATVIECPKEAAEHYREALEGCGLTATIEPC